MTLTNESENLQSNPPPESAGPNPTLLSNIRRFSRYGPTLRAAAVTLLSAIFLPAVCLFLAWQLSPAYEIATLKGCIVRGILLCTPTLFVALLLMKALRSKGLAESFFGWSPQLCKGLLATVSKIVWVCIPAKFMYTALETFEGGEFHDSLGRLFFAISMAALAIGLWESSRKLSRWLNESAINKRDWSLPLRKAILTALTAVPIGLLLMAVSGYYFSAIQLTWRVIWTPLIAIGIGLTTGMVSRLLLITQFRIKLRQLNRNDEGLIHEDESIDISEISSQVNRLLRVTAYVVAVLAGWQLWSQVIPEKGFLDSVQLWQHITDEGVTQFTLKHLLLSGGVLAITYVLSKNLPGLLEITLLDRLPLDKGGRYAISFVCRYVVGIIGSLFAFQMIGFSWSSVQWLAAGLTVGLGFGLQEIFANLVSGIIILIERPVRVGDVVTVNGVTGTVTRMQLRATTIKDLDYRELIVPNKKFITEDVMNWTLTERHSRLVFNVGIAYGSDTELAHRTLLAVAHRNPLVAKNPAPQVVFIAFGDSTLNFELRLVIPSRDNFSQIQHEINMAIDKAFREQDIEIAFPQQDVHLKGIEPLLSPSPEPNDSDSDPESGLSDSRQVA